jgi:hypothetical protein
MVMAFSVDDIERAHKQKKLAALMGTKVATIENDIHSLHDYYRAGRSLHDRNARLNE